MPTARPTRLNPCGTCCTTDHLQPLADRNGLPNCVLPRRPPSDHATVRTGQTEPSTGFSCHEMRAPPPTVSSLSRCANCERLPWRPAGSRVGRPAGAPAGRARTTAIASESARESAGGSDRSSSIDQDDADARLRHRRLLSRWGVEIGPICAKTPQGSGLPARWLDSNRRTYARRPHGTPRAAVPNQRGTPQCFARMTIPQRADTTVGWFQSALSMTTSARSRGEHAAKYRR